MASTASNSQAPIQEAAAVLTRLPKVMDSLLAVIEQETALVRAGKLGEAAKLEPVKGDLAVQYVRDAGWLKDNLAGLSGQAASALGALREKHDLFRALLQINLTVLATAHAVSEGIMRGVSDELSRKAQPATYGASGRATMPRPGAAQPLTVSRVL
jgi:hypothetical protein